MKYVFFVFFVLSLQYLFAQNLIPNPGFDSLSNCPFDFNQIAFAGPWVSATNGSPDLYNICSNEDFKKIPNAGHFVNSYQVQKSGTGYSYILVYSNVGGDSRGNSEYIETPLKEPLKKGETYYLEFYVSPDFGNGVIYTDAVGMAFSNSFYYQNLGPMEALPLNPVIENRGVMITDTVGWTRVNGCYTANGNEKYAIIGNFRNTEETLVEELLPHYPNINYFYIEDVLVMAFNPLPDTVFLCDDAPVELDATFLDASYLWSTGETDATIEVDCAGQFWVEAFMGECILSDTVVIIDTRKIEGFASEIEICHDEPLTLLAPLPGEYSWTGGAEVGELIVSSPGHYQVAITNECGEFVFSTQIKVENCMCDFYVPNIFSPNGDGINDFFEIFVSCDYEYQIRSIRVFDRWGNLVYSSFEGEATRWDGTFQNSPLPGGVYVWFLEYDMFVNNELNKMIKKGDVFIIR